MLSVALLGLSAPACPWHQMATLKPMLRSDPSSGRMDFTVHDSDSPGIRPLDAIPRLFGRLLGLHGRNGLTGIYRRFLRDGSDRHFFQRFAEAARMDIRFDPAKLRQVPKDGPLIIIANHPFTGADGLAIAAMISRVRPDVKVLMTEGMSGFAEARPHVIVASPLYGTPEYIRKVNRAGAVESARFLRGGGALVIFPGGEGPLPGSRGSWVEPEWKTGVARLAAQSGATILPVFVNGTPTTAYGNYRRYLPALAALVNGNEILHHASRPIELVVGDPVPFSRIQPVGDAGAQTNALSELVFSLRPDGVRRPASDGP